MTQESFKLQKRALLLDFVCITVALVTIYLANKGLLPMWALLTGAIVALLLLVKSIYLLMKSRKIEREAMRTENELAIKQAMEEEEKEQP